LGLLTFLFGTSSFWYRNVSLMSAPCYFGSAQVVLLRRLSAGEEFCLSVSCTLIPSPTFDLDISLFLFFFAVLGLELGAYSLSHSTSPFLWWFFSR
jgi:hypothetical protein